MGARRVVTRLQDLDDVGGSVGAGKVPIWDAGQSKFVLTDVESDAKWETWYQSAQTPANISLQKPGFGFYKGRLWMLWPDTFDGRNGVWRYENGDFVKKAAPAIPMTVSHTHGDVSGREIGGALLWGSTTGALYKQTFTAQDEFAAFAQFGAALGEDIFLGPVAWGKLYIGVFPGLGGNATLWTTDGVNAAVQVAEFVGVDKPKATVFHDGLLWVLIELQNSPDGYSEVWVVDRYGNKRLIDAGVGRGSGLTVYRDELVLARSARVAGVWRDRIYTLGRGGFESVYDQPETGGGILYIKGFGEQLLIGLYTSGIHVTDDLVTWRALDSSGGAPVPNEIVVHDGYLWGVKNQPITVVRRPLGLDRLRRQPLSHAGYQGGGYTVVDQTTAGALILLGGARVTSGAGAPVRPHNVDPKAGDCYLRTDTPTIANQRIYVCTVGGPVPTWVGIA